MEFIIRVSIEQETPGPTALESLVQMIPSIMILLESMKDLKTSEPPKADNAASAGAE